MTAIREVADLLTADPVWRRFFRRCCELGEFRLQAQAWQFRAELAERGVQTALDEVQDALAVIAVKTLPASLAGRGETAAGVLESEQQVFDLAREILGADDEQGAA
ncbi:MAG: hypothetical protein H0W52_15025 [Rubrobacteraceae bacterium]|jgi:hypothetical protein|nr:hypothetical protein [Rubrobacteraceae bacterium]